jgi:hypothetical protein
MGEREREREREIMGIAGLGTLMGGPKARGRVGPTGELRLAQAGARLGTPADDARA